jgi:phospholipase C
VGFLHPTHFQPKRRAERRPYPHEQCACASWETMGTAAGGSLAGAFLLFLLLAVAPPLAASGNGAADVTPSPPGPDDAPWSAKLEKEFKRLQKLLPTLEYTAAQKLLQEAKRRLGPRPRTLHYPQDKIEHMVVLFVENRASDHVWSVLRKTFMPFLKSSFHLKHDHFPRQARDKQM